MAASDLDAAIAALAAVLAPGLLAEARAEAVAEVRAELTARLSAELMRRCEAELGIEASAPRADERPAPDAAPAPEPEADLATAPEPEENPAPEPEPDAEPEPETHPLAENARREAVGYYVYGVVRSGVALPRDLVGVDPTAPVRLVESRGLAALVSEVPLAEFDEESLRRNLNDVAWLEEKARAHERVLEAALAATAVVPLRLCTVFTGEDQVVEMLGREYGVLLDALERLTGRAEWGVKAFVGREAIEREALRRAAQADEAEEEDEIPAGTAYMNRRRREARAREEAEEIADEWGAEIHGALAAVAGEALLNPLQRPELSGHPGEMLLNGVYLIADEEVADFRSVARVLTERYDRRGVEIVVTGPWPAYNFVKSSIEAAR